MYKMCFTQRWALFTNYAREEQLSRFISARGALTMRLLYVCVSCLISPAQNTQSKSARVFAAYLIGAKCLNMYARISTLSPAMNVVNGFMTLW
jgi:hypothetical protein